MNGREFDALTESNFHRYLGLGDFAEDGPSATSIGFAIESVTATDKWTVEIRRSNSPVGNAATMAYGLPLPREVVEEYGT